MSALEQAGGGPAIEVVAKATRRRFTVEYKRKIVREADACRTPGAVGAFAAAGGAVLLAPDDVARGPGAGRVGRGAEETRADAAGRRSAGQEAGRASAGDQPVAEACRAS